MRKARGKKSIKSMGEESNEKEKRQLGALLLDKKKRTPSNIQHSHASSSPLREHTFISYSCLHKFSSVFISRNSVSFHFSFFSFWVLVFCGNTRVQRAQLDSKTKSLDPILIWQNLIRGSSEEDLIRNFQGFLAIVPCDLLYIHVTKKCMEQSTSTEASFSLCWWGGCSYLTYHPEIPDKAS